MQEVVDLIVLYLIAISGWCFFEILHLPVSTLLGGMTFVVILKAMGFSVPSAPPYLFSVLQIFLGLYIGSKIDRENLNELRTMYIPVIIIVIWVTIITIGLGWILSNFSSSIDFKTALLGGAPGGVFECSVIALAIGADISVVVFLQVTRLFITLFSFSFLFSPKNDKKKSIKQSLKSFSLPNIVQKIVNSLNYKRLLNLDGETKSYPWKHAFIGTFVAALGGGLFEFLRFPAGALIGSIFAVSVVSILGTKVKPLPMWLHKYVLIGLGAIIGHNFTTDILINLHDYYSVAIVMMVIMLASSFIVAQIIRKVSNWDFHEAILASAPAGMTSMVILADSLKIDSLRISVLQLARLLTIKLIVIILFWFNL